MIRSNQAINAIQGFAKSSFSWATNHPYSVAGIAIGGILAASMVKGIGAAGRNKWSNLGYSPEDAERLAEGSLMTGGVRGRLKDIDYLRQGGYSQSEAETYVNQHYAYPTWHQKL